MQQVLEKQRKKTIMVISPKQYEQAWKNFWAMCKELEKRWKTKKSWLEILREERSR
ncbi:MAG: hypothetical protein HY001_03950 [Candidatus Portnoybacteria bacterium]|nr:hypothetical protein [Candidatus Portnoybacteria bacterium]